VETGTLLKLGFVSEFGRPGFTVYAPSLGGQTDAQKLQQDKLIRRINQLKMATTQYSIVYATAPII
jgi:hypothetical protein